MEKPLVFLDIDDTLLETKTVQKLFLSQRYKFNSLEELNYYFNKIKLEELFDIGREILNFQYADFLFQRISHAYETLRNLKNDYRFECCTARPLCHSSLIDKIIFDYYESCIDKIHYFGELTSKVRFSQEKGARLLVDDSINSFKGIKNSGLKGVLYNKGLIENKEELIIMDDWRKFPEILESSLF